jgi:hypothetical protein
MKMGGLKRIYFMLLRQYKTADLIVDKISVRRAKNAKSGLQDLCSYVKCINPTIDKVIEVGSYVGDSTEVFAKNFEKVISIDAWKNGYDDNDASSYKYPMEIVEAQFDEFCKKYPNINKMKMTSREASKIFQNDSLMFIYIDALHTYEGVKKDISLWWPKLKVNGFLALHDYSNVKRHPGVQKAFDEIFKFPDATFNDTSCIIKKIEGVYSANFPKK